MDIKELYEHSEFKPLYEEYLASMGFLRGSLTFDVEAHNFSCKMCGFTYYGLSLVKRKNKKPDTYFLDIVREWNPDNLQLFMTECFTHDKGTNMLSVESRRYLKTGEIIEKTKLYDLALERLMTAEPLSQKKLKKIGTRKNRK